MPIRTGLIGFGYWGPNLARNIHNSAEYDFKLVIESDSDRANIAKETFSIEVCSSLQVAEKLDDLDLVFVATKPKSHLGLCRELLNRGINVVMPKPVTTNLRDAEEVRNLAANRNLKVFCDYTYRYSTNYGYMKSWVNQKKLKSYTSFRRSLGIYQSDVDVILDLASHDFSILLGIKGSLPSSISCIDTSPNLYFDNSTSASLVARWDDGFCADVHVSWNAPKKVRNIILSTEESSLIIDETNTLQQISEISHSPNHKWENESEKYRELNTSFTLGEEKFVNLVREESLEVEVRRIARFMNNVEPSSNVVLIDDALLIWKMLEMAERALRAK